MYEIQIQSRIKSDPQRYASAMVDSTLALKVQNDRLESQNKRLDVVLVTAYPRLVLAVDRLAIGNAEREARRARS